MMMQQDLANRLPNIHWPPDFSPDQADYFAHNDLYIAAPCEKVWQKFVAVTQWPQWFVLCKKVEIISGGSDELQQGTVFRWTSSVVADASIHEFIPFSRIGWYGYTPGTEPAYYHAWCFVPEGQGCRAIYEEVGKGEAAIRLREKDEGGLHRSHDLMLASLRWVSEG